MDITFPLPSSPDIECVDFNDVFASGKDVPAAIKLLGKAHEGIYQKTFPIPEEQEALDDWIARLYMPAKEKQIFAAFGKNLNSDNPEIMGFISSSYYGGTKTGLICYVVKELEHKNKLSGKEMCAYHEKKLNQLSLLNDKDPLKGVFWEANDPNKIIWNESDPNRLMIDCMAPQKRVDHIEGKFAARRLGFDYVQVPLAKGMQACEDLLLYQYNATNYKDLTPQDLRTFLVTFGQALAGVNNPRELKNKKVNRMMDQVDLMIADNIPVLQCDQTTEQKEKLKHASDLPLADTLSPFGRNVSSKQKPRLIIEK